AVEKTGDIDMYMTVNFTDKSLTDSFEISYGRDDQNNVTVKLKDESKYELKDNENGTYSIMTKDSATPTPGFKAEQVGVVKLTTEGRYGEGDVDATKTSHKTSFTEGDKNKGLDFQVGANTGDMISVKMGTMNAETLGLNSLDLSNQKNAEMAINQLDLASSKISSTRSDLGAAQNRMQHTINNLAVAQENLTEANSRIRDVDMAEEMMNFTKNNILSQAATSMLSQANAMPQSVLSLLQ
ncbi:MAG: flagellin, partial [Vagococcus sp.]